jgi:hypothetical protein
MRPINPNAAEPANIISIETLKRAETPVNTTSIVTDAINGLEKLSNNPVFAPLFSSAAQLIQAKAEQMIKGAQGKQTNESEVLFQ